MTKKQEPVTFPRPKVAASGGGNGHDLKDVEQTSSGVASRPPSIQKREGASVSLLQPSQSLSSSTPNSASAVYCYLNTPREGESEPSEGSSTPREDSQFDGAVRHSRNSLELGE